MPDRYELSPMKEIWQEDAKYARWLKVELEIIRAMQKTGDIDVKVANLIIGNSSFTVKEILKEEKVIRHDVLAFVNVVGKKLGKDSSYFHKGITSSDIVDTAIGLAIKESSFLILNKLDNVSKSLQKLANKYSRVAIMGRTHGVHAEPTTFGQKLLNHFFEFKRNKERLKQSFSEAICGKVSGSVGNYAHISPKIEVIVLKNLGLNKLDTTNQIIPRDCYARLMSDFALLGCAIERFATEIRHLHRTEVGEVCEGFCITQKGSSSMPHKRNPISCEQLCGLSRMLRSYAQVAFENINLWHERDISHSSAERFIFPEAFNTVFYMLQKCNSVINELQINPQKMIANMKISQDLSTSQTLLMEILNTNKVSRNEAYNIVQNKCKEASEKNISLKELTKNWSVK